MTEDKNPPAAPAPAAPAPAAPAPAAPAPEPQRRTPFMRLLRIPIPGAAGTIRARLLIAFVSLVVIPALILLSLTTILGVRNAQREAIRELQSIAALKEAQIHRWIEELNVNLQAEIEQDQEEQRLQSLLADPDSAAFLAVYQAQLQQFQRTLAIRGIFEEIFLMDRDGEIILSTDPLQRGKIHVHQSYFQEGARQPYVQPPAYSPSLGQTTVVAAHPIVNEQGLFLGVLAGRANLDVLNRIMLEEGGPGATGDTYLVGLNQALITESRFLQPGRRGANIYVRTEGAAQVLNQKSNGSHVYRNSRDVMVIGVYRWLPELQIALLAEIARTEALEAIIVVNTITVITALLSVGFAVAAALFVTRSIADPLGELAHVAQNVAAGNLDMQVTAVRSDEIGVVGHAFNSMTAQLGALIGNLEQRVAERTTALETSITVSRSLSTILDQQQLVTEVAEQVRAAFNYYHAHIYLWDESNENLVMAGGTGEAGRLMLARGHKIPRGRGLVGKAAEANDVILVPDVSQETEWLPNPLLPATRSEVAIPIALGENVLGVLDVQDEVVNGLGEEDARLLQSVANQVAIALRNARLYQLAQQHADQEALINMINHKIQAATDVESVLQIAAQELGRALGAQRASVQLGNGHRQSSLDKRE